MDISGRWSYSKDRWNSPSSKNDQPSFYNYFENSFYHKYLELSQFELFINKLKLNEDEEGLFFMLKAPKHPLVEEKISFSRFNTLTGQDHSISTLVIVQNFHKHTSEFQILRLGPNPTQSCTEFYRFDPNGRIHIILVSYDQRGNKITLVRSFERMEDPTAQQREKIRLFMTEKTGGWNEICNFPGSLIELIEVKLESVRRFTDSSEQSEILFTQTFSNDQKQLVQFKEEFQNFSHVFQFKVTVGDSSWTVNRSYEEMRDLGDFVRSQMIPASDRFNYKKMSKLKNWKSYVEFLRNVHSAENVFTTIKQNCEDLNYNSILSILYFLEFPQHLDAPLVTFLERMLALSLKTPNPGDPSFTFEESSLLNTLERSYLPPGSNVTSAASSPTVPADSHSSPRGPNSIAARMGHFNTNNANPLNNSRRQRPFNIAVETELRRSSSGEIVGYKDVYTIPASVKYMPVDIVATPSIKKSIARSLLFSALKSGMIVIKHGRSGKPKKRILTCDASVTALFWLSEKSQFSEGDAVVDTKSINIDDVLELREGTDIDPETSPSALTAAAANGSIKPEKLLEIARAKEELRSTDRKSHPSQSANLFESIFGTKEKDGILLGTANLRRHCKAEDYKLSFSLILPDRTFDVQCLSRQDYDTLVINLRELTNHVALESSGHGAKGLPSTWSFNSPDPMDNPLKRKPSLKRIQSSNISPKKSVRFLDTAGDNDAGNNSSGNSSLSSPQRNRSNTSRDMSSVTSLTMSTTGESIASEEAPSKHRRTSGNSEVIYADGIDGNLDLLLTKDDTKIESQDSLDEYAPPKSHNNSIRRKGSDLRMSSTEALQLGMLLAEQEKRFGANMYETLQKEDEPMVQEYVSKGYTTEEAILLIFEDRYINPKTEKQPITPRRKASIIIDDNADSKDPLIGRKSPLFPTLLNSQRKASEKTMDEKSSIYIPNESPTNTPFLKMSAAEALQIGLLLSQQEQEFGTNMYESLLPNEEEELVQLVNTGMQSHEAALHLFQKKFSYRVQSEEDPATIISAESAAALSTGKEEFEESKAENEKLRIVIHPAEVLNRSGSSLFPTTSSVIPVSPREYPRDDANPEEQKGAKRLSSAEAIELAMVLSEQESRYGVNMYDSLTTDDEPEIHSLMERGMKMEDAVLAIFERKYVHQQAPPSRQNSNHYYSSATTNTHHSSSQFSLGSNGYSPAVPTSANQGFNPPPLVHSYRGGSMSSMPLPSMPSTYSVHSATSYEGDNRRMYPQDPSYPPSPYVPSPHMDPMNPMSPYMQQYPPSPMMPMHGGMQSSYGFMPSPGYHPNMPSPGYPPGMYNSFYGMPHTASSYNSPNQPFMNPPPAVALAVPERGASTRTGQQAVRRSSNSTRTSTSTTNSNNNSPVAPLNRNDSTQQSSSGGKKLRITQMLGVGGGGKSKHKCKESDVKKITEMGFTRDQAVTALMQNDNNLVMAIHSLTG